MLRSLTLTGITALAIAISPVNAPSAKAASDFGKFVIGATALAIIGGIAIRENKKRRRRAAAQSQRQMPAYETPAYQNNYNNQPTYYSTLRHAHGRYGMHVHHGSRNNHSRVLKEVVVSSNTRPQQCRRQGWGTNGFETYYDYSCVQQYQRVRTIVHFR